MGAKWVRVVALLACLSSCPLVAGLQDLSRLQDLPAVVLWCVFRPFLPTFRPFAAFAFLQYLLNMALFRVFRGFLARFMGFVLFGRFAWLVWLFVRVNS